MPYTYWEDTSKKDQVRGLMDEGSVPLVPNEDVLAIMDATVSTTYEEDGTYETPSK
jgi:hypothetical protein